MNFPCIQRDSASKLLGCLKFGAWLAVTVIATGCGKSDEKKPATQVAAKVNGYEITVHQINDVLGRQNLRAEQVDAAKQQVLDRLIDQQLAKQQAIERKLDRSPSTVQAMESAKNDILARAYLEQIEASQSKPTAEEVKKYYAEHPELFAERRLYSLEELTVSKKDAAEAAVKEQAARARDLREISATLKAKNAPVEENRGIRAAEQIPLAWLSELRKMKDGDIRVFENGDRLEVIRVVATRQAPVDEATAAPRIQQFLFNRRLSEAIASDVKQLREKSNIDYMGEFANRHDLAKSAAKPEAFQPPSEPAPPAPNSNFDKGIRGLR